MFEYSCLHFPTITSPTLPTPQLCDFWERVSGMFLGPSRKTAFRREV